MQLSPSQFEHTVVGLLSGQPYSFWVSATTAIGEGAASSVVTEYPKRLKENLAAMISSFSRVISVAKGDRVSLPCRNVGKPTPTIHWLYK